MTLDRNKTVWQRLHDAIDSVFEPGEVNVDRLTNALHMHVVNERRDAHSIGLRGTPT